MAGRGKETSVLWLLPHHSDSTPHTQGDSSSIQSAVVRASTQQPTPQSQSYLQAQSLEISAPLPQALCGHHSRDAPSSKLHVWTVPICSYLFLSVPIAPVGDGHCFLPAPSLRALELQCLTQSPSDTCGNWAQRVWLLQTEACCTHTIHPRLWRISKKMRTQHVSLINFILIIREYFRYTGDENYLHLFLFIFHITTRKSTT